MTVDLCIALNLTLTSKTYMYGLTTLSVQLLWCSAVEGAELFVCGNFVYNHYHDCKDTNYLLCGDKINDILSLPFEQVQELIPILACQDRVLRVLRVSIMYLFIHLMIYSFIYLFIYYLVVPMEIFPHGKSRSLSQRIASCDLT